MGEIHELFVLALPLVWFARATPASGSLPSNNRSVDRFSSDKVRVHVAAVCHDADLALLRGRELSFK